MHSGNSLLDLLQLLEIWTAPDSFCRAVRACTALHYTRGGFSTAAPLSGWELGTIFVLRNIADVIGKAQLITALEALEGPQRLDHRALARGFGVRFLPSSGLSDTPLPTHEDRCAFCGELRYLRSACLACGAAHCLKISSRLPRLSMSHGGNIMKLDTTQLENLRLHAIEAGITYINDCAQEPKIFKEFGGDMIFLFRNLVHSVGLNGQICKIQNDSDYKHDIERSLQAASCFAELLARWATGSVRGGVPGQIQPKEFCVQGVRPEAWFRFLGRRWQFGALPSFVGGIWGPHRPPAGVITIKCEIVRRGLN